MLSSTRWLPMTFRGYERRWLGSDLLAGITLAALAIPECMGYTKIVGTPVVTGLYTLLLPAAAFALLASSRHLVVGADSATAAILFAGLAGLAQPLSAHWLSLTSAAALLTAACLAVSSGFHLGFLADFLSRTVLVGFLSGVGVSVLLGQIPDMLGIPVGGRAVWNNSVQVITSIGQIHWLTLAMAIAMIGFILVAEKRIPWLPAPLIAVTGAIALTWMFHLDRDGIAVVGHVEAGIPTLRVPRVSGHELAAILPTCASMFLVIVAQSAATARGFAQKHGEQLNENRDLFALAAANVLAGLSSTFVVNGSPTKTAVADAAGSRTQAAQLTMAVVVLATLLVATRPIERLPVGALAALVFVIGLKLVDVRSLREIYRFRRATFLVALSTLAAVVVFGFERGVFVAIVLSVIDHLRQEYHPKDVVLTLDGDTWKALRARRGLETEPGLIVYRFQAPLFFANADYFAARVNEILTTAPHRVQWLVLDLVSMNDVDYTGGLTLAITVKRLQAQGITVALAAAEDVIEPLRRLGVAERIGRDRFFDSVQGAIETYRRSLR